ncbi:MBL fold metallo-hydrolase [Lederbergia panacisoli]|uniref:MBL fold metallo-hydrolase n=1 Tax=Lederbergia panacisoli TaxID=1255251 RepID=UPI00214B0421|nr:MBL fold metallo-hydrolase [Lederbergia panacisoli]MCR2821041.1 MBL fold metallo-hydrolase [Lederbergia panacisoli]
MEITVIGHWGGYPKAGEASSGYLLTHDGFNLLIDCGSAVLSQLQMYINPEELNAVILSHYHADHIADIGVLHHALLISKYVTGYNSNLPIYGHTYDQEGYMGLTYKDITTGIPYDKNDQTHIGPFKLEFLKTKHPVPCFAMRISCNEKTLVYTADSAYFDDLISFSKDADILLAESNFYKGMNGADAGHMTSEEAGKLAKKANVKKLVLTHLPHFGDLNQLKAEAAEYFKQEVILASKGLKLAF